MKEVAEQLGFACLMLFFAEQCLHLLVCGSDRLHVGVRWVTANRATVRA